MVFLIFSTTEPMPPSIFCHIMCVSKYYNRHFSPLFKHDKTSWQSIADLNKELYITNNVKKKLAIE